MKLQLIKLTKKYGSITALNNFTMKFKTGLYSILGENGAGKSTIMKLITDNIPRDKGKDAGKILFNGREILDMGSDFRQLVGYMPQQSGYYRDFTAEAFLSYMAYTKGINRRIAQKQIHELLGITNLEDKAHQKMEGLSGGMKQRLLLAQALLGDPQILILDEPTVGLDPKERIVMRNYIKELSAKKIVLLATHIVSDIECISDYVLLMKHGELLISGTPEELIKTMSGRVAEIDCTYEEYKLYQKKYVVGNLKQKGQKITVRIIGDRFPEKASLNIHDINLEDVYLYVNHKEVI